MRDRLPSIEPDPSPRRGRRHPARWLAPLIGLLAAVALVSVFWQPQLRRARRARAGGAPAAGASSTARAATGDAARYPILASSAPQPPIDASDAALEAGLRALVAGGALAAIVEPRDFVRNVVATVDNLPRRSLFAANMPVKPVPGPFQTTFATSGLAIADANAARYAAYVRVLELVDAAKLVALYERHYPLFEQAYRELGYPSGHFNDRLVEAIEVALATPAGRAAASRRAAEGVLRVRRPRARDAALGAEADAAHGPRERRDRQGEAHRDPRAADPPRRRHRRRALTLSPRGAQRVAAV